MDDRGKAPDDHSLWEHRAWAFSQRQLPRSPWAVHSRARSARDCRDAVPETLETWQACLEPNLAKESFAVQKRTLVCDSCLILPVKLHLGST
jgi:hypothetical protein